VRGNVWQVWRDKFNGTVQTDSYLGAELSAWLRVEG
jgi:hypothetical protein